MSERHVYYGSDGTSYYLNYLPDEEELGRRARLNFDTSDLDVVRRLSDAQREVRAAADELFRSKTSRKDDRQALARRLNAVASSLKTVELRLCEGTVEE